MRKVFLPCLMAFAVAQLSAQCYNLVWQDEFSGTSLSTANWNHWVGPAYNNELQYYTARPENVAVGNGLLKLIALDEDYNGYNYTSGRIDTRYKVDFAYGKVEGRMKLVNGQGLWPAFWLLPTNGAWPAGGEIDIMEVIGQEPNKTYGTCHYAVNGTLTSLGGNYVLPTGTFADGFHTFAVEWSPTLIKWSVDGSVFYSVTKTQVGSANWPFSKPFYVILNLAVGGNWPGPPDANTAFPATMEVDWVRIYQTNSYIKISGSTLCEPNTSANYKLPAWAGGTYNWSIPAGGTIVSGQGTPNINVNWATAGTRSVNCTFVNSCGSKATTLAVKVSPNLWTNNGFESGTEHWNFVKNPPANATFTVVSSNAAPEGAKTSKVVVSALGPNSWDIQLARANVAVKKDTSYTFRFWAKANAAGKHTQVNFLNPTNFTNYAWQNIALTTAWTQYSLTFVAPYTGNLLFTEDFNFQTGTFFTDNYFFGRSSIAAMPQAAAVRAPGEEDFETAQSLDFQVFPNPVCDALNFVSPEKGDFSMLDFSGKAVLAGEIHSDGQQTVSLQGLPAGVYFLEIRLEHGGRLVEKVLKN